MKITVTADSKKCITVAEMPIVRQIIEELKQNDDTVKDYAEMAARIASGGYVMKVFECSAEIAKNCRVWNAYNADSCDLDVWVDFTAYTSEGFVIGGAYLTDLWSIDGDNTEEIRSHMFIRKFTETK